MFLFGDAIRDTPTTRGFDGEALRLLALGEYQRPQDLALVFGLEIDGGTRGDEPQHSDDPIVVTDEEREALAAPFVIGVTREDWPCAVVHHRDDAPDRRCSSLVSVVSKTPSRFK